VRFIFVRRASVDAAEGPILCSVRYTRVSLSENPSFFKCCSTIVLIYFDTENIAVFMLEAKGFWCWVVDVLIKIVYLGIFSFG